MTEFETKTLIQLTRIADALTHQALLMVQAMAPSPEPEPQEPPTCPHPEDQRMQLGQTTGFKCLACEEMVLPT